MLNTEQKIEEPKLNIENNSEILSSVYGAIISQKSKKDFVNTHPIKLSKQNQLIDSPLTPQDKALRK
jgi:hypothetical protein